MIGIGIKNAILFLLIILILHFLIKNMLLDRGVISQPGKAGVSGEHKYFENFTDQKMKMMQYIMEEPSTIDKAFNEKIIQPCETTKVNDCPPMKSDDNKIERSMSCDNILKTSDDADAMKLKADCKLAQDKKDFMVIKEYENEKGLNGGELFDGLNAFDNYDMYFQTYSSQCGAPTA